MHVYKIKPDFKMSLKIRKPSFKRRSKFSDSNPCQSCLTRIFTKYTPFCSTSCSLERFMQPFANGNVFFFLTGRNLGEKRYPANIYRFKVQSQQ